MSDLVRYDEVRRELEAAESVDVLGEAKARIEAATAYARRQKMRPAVLDGVELSRICERRIGQVLAQTVRQGGHNKANSDGSSLLPDGISWDQSSRWQNLAKLSDDDFEEFLDERRLEGEESDLAALLRLERRLRKQGKPPTPPSLDGEFCTWVVDPPWPMQKIDREVRPNQGAALDYAPMTVDELREFDLAVAGKVSDNAHLYLWTTHKHLPLALQLAEAWGFKYQCLLTWVKNVGITPFSFMYSTEHVVFGRRGNLDLSTLGRRLDFAAAVREHSRKPDEFYDLVREVSPGPRVDVFAREAHDGFDTWGSETERFADAA